MPEQWIEAAAQQMYECMFGNIDRKLACEIIQRHYDAASQCGMCHGRGEICYDLSGVVRHQYSECKGTGKVVPSV